MTEEHLVKWLKYELEQERELSAEQMRFIYQVDKYAKITQNTSLHKMCVDFYNMRMYKDM